MPFGRDGLFTLVGQLTGLDMAEDYHPRATFRGSPPVVLIEGWRGMGKTALNVALPAIETQCSTTGTANVVDRVFLNGAPKTSKSFVTNGG